MVADPLLLKAGSWLAIAGGVLLVLTVLMVLMVLVMVVMHNLSQQWWLFQCCLWCM